MQQTYNLRKFKPNDLQRVIHINLLCLPENYMDFFFMDLHKRFPETFIVAEEDAEIVGYIMCRIEVGLASLDLGGLIKKGHVVSIAVLPQGRRKGVAQALMTRAMECMRQYNAKICYLEVRATNKPGVALYKKLGFEVSRTIRGYYSDNEDAYVMTKKL
jgi:ribosomal-protein-alanine N-acetyltransferase